MNVCFLNQEISMEIYPIANDSRKVTFVGQKQTSLALCTDTVFKNDDITGVTISKVFLLKTNIWILSSRQPAGMTCFLNQQCHGLDTYMCISSVIKWS